jgi:hypothetical protein
MASFPHLRIKICLLCFNHPDNHPGEIADRPLGEFRGKWAEVKKEKKRSINNYGKLSEEDLALFYRLHPVLLLYANQQLKIIDKVSTVKELINLPLEKKVKIRDALYNRIDLIGSFVQENPLRFSADELGIVLSWRNFVRGKFYLLRYLKKYAIFLDTDSPPRAYGVLALTNSFDEVLSLDLPIMLETVLLPFRGQIIYDGFMSPHRIAFGSGVRQDLNDAYQEAKSRFGIIISLPFSTEEVKESDANRLRFYLKSKRNRELYFEGIKRLVNKDPGLLELYHQEMGKIHARAYGKQLREIGFTNVWFAILEGIIIASGKTKIEVEQTLQGILPGGKERFVYIFHLREY